MNIESVGGGLPEKNAGSNKLQNDLVHYLSIVRGYEDRPAEILARAKEQEVPLDLDSAIKEGIVKALEEEAPENLDLIMAFAQKHEINVDMALPDMHKAIEHSYAELLSKTRSAELASLKEFIDKYNVPVDENLIFQNALVMTLNRGDGQRANSLANKIIKEKKNISFSNPEISAALKQGLIKTLQEGRADIVNRLLNFGKRRHLGVQTDKPEFINAAKEGLIKSIKNMRLGPGGVALAERMVKLIRKSKYPIDLNDPEVVKASKEALEAAKKSHKVIPEELQVFRALPHIEAFLKKYGIDIT